MNAGQLDMNVDAPPSHSVLVVDDDIQVAAVLAEFVERLGYGALVAHSSDAARRILRDRDVSVVLLDLGVPDVSGGDLVRRFRAGDSAPDVIVLTAEATVDSAIAAMEARAAGYLEKPFSYDALGALIERAIGRRGSARARERRRALGTDRLREADAVIAMSTALAATPDLDEALRRACRELVRLTGADTAAAYLSDPERDALVPCAAYHVPKHYLEQLATSVIPMGEKAFGEPLARHSQPLWSDDVGSDPRFRHALFRQVPHQSGLLLPLRLDGAVVGAFYLAWWHRRRTFDAAELRLVARVSAQVTLLLRDVRVFEQVRAYSEALRARVAHELGAARQIQANALPRDFESLTAGTALEVHAVMEPARQVGGDLYEVVRLSGGRLLMVLGDVSGKGVPAAMFMMMATAFLRVAAREGGGGSELLARLNDQLCADNPTSMFVTLACAEVDGESGAVRYALAGHPPPVVLTAEGEARVLRGDPGTIAGVEPGLAFPSRTTELGPGDTLVLYSDGVTEMFDAQGRAFGEEGLVAALHGFRAPSAKAVVERLISAVQAFAAGAEPSDDVAILAVRRLVPAPLVLEVVAEPRAVVEATDRVRAWCRAAGIPRGPAHDLALALDEIGTNVATHALGQRPGRTFRVRLECSANAATLEIRDDGPPFNPLEAPPAVFADRPADQPIGGLGLALVRTMMTRAEWTRDASDNVLTLTRALDE